ncbi:MAG: GspE/PulE family protein [Proteobacteria bacterium]|nr:GspE/PulE family protein [Pseudomonadota bacterium]
MSANIENAYPVADTEVAAPPEEADLADQFMQITVGLCSGTTRRALIRSFSPYAPHLTLWEGLGGPTRVSRVGRETLSYIAFHTLYEGSDPLSSVTDLIEVRVYLNGGGSLLVRASKASLDQEAGFYGQPASFGDESTRCYFLFGHAVTARESTELIGTMLVDSGLINAQELQEGLDVQQKRRRIPIGEILADRNEVLTQSDVDRARAIQERRRVRIGDALVEAGLVTAEDVEKALAEQREHRDKRLGEILIELGFIDEMSLCKTLGQKFQMPVVNLDEVEIHPAATVAVAPDIMRKYCILPIHIDDDKLVVAQSDPLAVEVYDILRFHVSKPIVEVLATHSQIQEQIDAQTEGVDEAELLVDDIIQELEDGAGDADEDAVTGEFDGFISETDSAVVRLVNKMIIDAHRMGASDIHIEPNGSRTKTMIRFRIDGSCALYHEIPAEYWRALVSRVKILSGLDIAERRKPQDGKIRVRTPIGSLELRVATIPTINGNEDVVLRVLGGQTVLLLSEMGLNQRNLEAIKNAIHQPHGLFLCVGPTGSGKTTTLHAALSAINNHERKIWTAEDPVEITQKGLRQVQVNSKIGFTFAAALRAFLRADPDVIMIGEMRDAETASIGVESSLTGHLVLSTLHTNSAPETVVRLLDMGIDQFAFADALTCVLAQRLARRTCQECKTSYTASNQEYETIAAWYGQDDLDSRFKVRSPRDLTLWQSQGCEKCNDTGTRGRVALHELLVSDKGLRRAIQKRAPAEELRKLACASGMRTLLQDGIEKVISGQTTLKHVMSVCGGNS